jgi:hypothetical protein
MQQRSDVCNREVTCQLSRMQQQRSDESHVCIEVTVHSSASESACESKRAKSNRDAPQLQQSCNISM